MEITVSVAASLTGTIEQVESSYTKIHPEITFRNNFGSSGALARQIEQGAPVDVLLAAGAKPVDQLVAKGLIAAGQNRILLHNQLVLIVPEGTTITSLNHLSQKQVKKIALGDPRSVPAGLYALQTLKGAKLDAALKEKFVFAKDVRQVLAYVESGNAEAGFVYATDARLSSKAHVAQTIDDAAHDPIVYPVAVVAQSAHATEARAFSDFLFSSSAAQVFAGKGFITAAHE